MDFGSEKLRFLGGARFDVYGFYKAILPRTFQASISEPIQSDSQAYYSISYSLLGYLSPTFKHDACCISTAPQSSSLLKYLFTERTGVKGERLRLEVVGKEERISIDGEPYRGNRIEGEIVTEEGLTTWE